MIVVIAGMYRSGSTFSFNIARECLAGEVDVLSDNAVTEAQLARAEGRNLLVKAHLPDKALVTMILDGRAACIVTYRKPEEAVASWMEAFGFSLEDSINAIREWLCWHASFEGPALSIPYTIIEERPLQAILRIQYFLTGRVDRRAARRLRHTYDKSRVKQEYDALQEGNKTANIGISYYDTTTFFHRRHVSTALPRDVLTTLSLAQVEVVRHALRGYIDADGMYLTRAEMNRPRYASSKSSEISATTDFRRQD